MIQQKKIYLVRHGEIDLEGKKRFIGQIDLPINENGRKQAACLRDKLACRQFGGIFCSDLERSVATARIICERQGAVPVPREDLREISLGSWEGLSFEDVRLLYAGEFEKRGADLIHYRPPGGESFAQCAERVRLALMDILAGSVGDTLIVGHAGVNRMILCGALGMPLENMFQIKQDYGCLNILSSGVTGLKAVTLNADE